MSIIVGLGTGRCGTASLAKLINGQPGAVCFHEINPSCMAWATTPGPVFSMLHEFTAILQGRARDRVTIDLTSPNRDKPLARLKQLPEVSVIGEIGCYYLPYVESILKEYPDTRFPCLQRNRDQTIQSFIAKMRVREDGRLQRIFKPRPQFRNHWVQHDGSVWARDQKWDKCFPNFDATTLEEAVSRYYDTYYEEAERLASKYHQVQIFELDDLNDENRQRELLQFCAIQKPEPMNIHENISKAENVNKTV